MILSTMTFVYSLLYAAALVFIFPFEYFRRPAGLRKRWFSERAGNIRSVPGGDGRVVWIHAVSVGEVLAALPLIRGLKESGCRRIVVSTVTDTGQQIARDRAPGGVDIVYLPFDLPCFLRRAIERISPALFITMETEIWPNLFVTMRKAGVPVFIFNGRISDRSFPRYRKIRFFLERLFSTVEAAGVQTGQDAERMVRMGMSPGRVHVTGNFKFDIQGTVRAPAWTERLRGMTIVAGSTHEGEEELVLECYLRLRERYGPLNLVLAPRHPQRFDRAGRLLEEKGTDFIRRSSLSGDTEELEGRVILMDVLGELAGLYSVADVCIIGGSFVPVGGHNLFEAAYWSRPIVCGPYMNNFPLARTFAERGAAKIVEPGGLCDILTELLESPATREEMGRNAFALFRDNGGAVRKAMNMLEPYLENCKG